MHCVNNFLNTNLLLITHTQYTKLYISLHPRISSILPQFQYAIGCKWCPRWPFVPSPWLDFAQGRARTRLGKPWSAGEFPNRMEVLARKILYNYRGFIGDLIIGFSMSFHFWFGFMGISKHRDSHNPWAGKSVLMIGRGPQSCSPKLFPKAAVQSCCPKAAILQTYTPKRLPKAKAAPQSCCSSKQLFLQVVPESLPKLLPKAVPRSCFPKLMNEI